MAEMVATAKTTVVNVQESTTRFIVSYQRIHGITGFIRVSETQLSAALFPADMALVGHYQQPFCEPTP